MYRFLQKHGKKIMAIFGAFLMISFTLPAAYRYGDNSRNPVVGTLEGEKLYANELFEASRSWELLSGLPIQGGSAVDILGPAAVAQIRQHPVLFLLLQKEAQRMGVRVNNDMLESIVRNSPGMLSGNEERDQLLRRAISDILLVRQGFQRATSAIKVTEPMISQQLAELQQSITLSAVEFNAAQYTEKIPAPSAEQLRAQFEKYADTLRGAASEGNPFGFGYRYPDRVKFQYIAIPRVDVRKVVEAARAKDPYAFIVEAQRYYLQNRAQFPSTQPAEKSADAFSLGSGGSTKPAATAPTTKPFELVEQEIKDRIIDAETDRRVAAITERINQQLAADWAAYSAARPNAATTQGTTSRPAAPPTSLGAPYDSLEYLTKLAAVIQKDFGVLPTVVSKADAWLTHEDLAKLPGVGLAAVGGIPLADYIMAFSTPFVAESDRDDQMNLIEVMEPTRPLNDSANNVYIARVSAAEPSHKPATLTEVENQVRADVIARQAFELAKADANALLAKARENGLETASGGKGLVSAGPLTRRQGQVVPTLTLTGDAATRFVDGAFKLLSTPTSRPTGKPVRLVEMPQDGRVFVAELGNVDAMWNERTRPMAEAQIRQMVEQELATLFGEEWFDYQAVTTRLSFKADEDFRIEDLAPPARSQPVRPLF